MATFNTQARIVLRHGPAAEWETKNPILLEGEIGAEADTGLLKMGDGSTNYNDLPYINATPAFVTEQLAGKLDKENPVINTNLTLNFTPTSAFDATNKEYVDTAIASADLLKRAIVDELPETNISANTIYMIRDDQAIGPDVYKEYLLIDNELVQIGDTSVDLTGFARIPNNFTEGHMAGFAANGNLVDLGAIPSQVSIPIAGVSTLGGVISSADDNSISVDNLTGKMSLNRVSVNNLFVPDGDELILYCGTSTEVI